MDGYNEYDIEHNVPIFNGSEVGGYRKQKPRRDIPQYNSEIGYDINDPNIPIFNGGL